MVITLWVVGFSPMMHTWKEHAVFTYVTFLLNILVQVTSEVYLINKKFDMLDKNLENIVFSEGDRKA